MSQERGEASAGRRRHGKEDESEPEKPTLKERDLAKKLEDMKMSNLSQLSHTVTVSLKGYKPVERNVLFMSNRQARRYSPHPSRGNQGLREALGVEKAPKLIIRLFDSWGLDTYQHTLPTGSASSYQQDASGMYELDDNAYDLGLRRDRFATEKDEKSLTRSHHDLLLFMAQIIIPLAARTNAIVLCSASEDCTLASTFASAIEAFGWSHTDDAPFTALGITNSLKHSYWMNSDQQVNNVFGDVFNQVSDLRESSHAIFQAVQTRHGPNKDDWPKADILRNLHKYIILDGCDEVGLSFVPNEGAGGELSTTLLESFSTLEAIPTICIRTFSSGDAVLSSPTASFVDAVTKSIPCLLLDTRSERAKAYRELCESEQVEQKSAKEVEHDETQHRSIGGFSGIAPNVRHAIEAFNANQESFLNNDKIDSYDNCTIAFFHWALHRREMPSAEGFEREEEAGEDEAHPELLYQAIERKESVGDIKWFDKGPVNRSDILAVCRTILKNESKMKFATLSNDSQKRQIEAGERPEYFLSKEWNERFMHLYKILAANNVFSGKLWQTDDLAKMINKMVILDDVPSENSLQELRVLRSAWKTVDEGKFLATVYKRVTKALYVILLTFGIVIVAFTVMSQRLDDEGSIDGQKLSSELVFLISLATAFTSGISSFFAPGQRWQQLRGASELLVSEIWKFRTRVGDYSLCEPIQFRSEGPEVQLEQRVSNIRESLLRSADLERSALGRVFSGNIYKHGQYYGALDKKHPGKWLEDDGSKRERALKRAFRKGSKVSPGSHQLDSTQAGDSEQQGRREGEPAQDFRGSPQRLDEEYDSDKGDVEETQHWQPEKSFEDTQSVRGEQKKPTDLVDAAEKGKSGETVPGKGSTRQVKYFDDHQTPLKPDDYIQFRLKPAMRFYQKRLPKYNFTRMAIQIFILLSSAAGAILARYGLTAIVAILSAFASAVTSYGEFHQTANKLRRYNASVTALINLLTWWESISNVDKSMEANVEHLIIGCESIISREREAWMSESKSPQQAKKQTKSTNSHQN